jgi:hypothetical protein
MQDTGTSAFMHAIRTVTISSSDVLTSMPHIAADMHGIVTADTATTTDTATTSIVLQEDTALECVTDGTEETIVTDVTTDQPMFMAIMEMADTADATMTATADMADATETVVLAITVITAPPVHTAILATTAMVVETSETVALARTAPLVITAMAAVDASVTVALARTPVLEPTTAIAV